MDNTLMFNLGKYLSEDGDMVGDLARGLRVFPGLREARALGAAKWVRGETSFCLGNVVMSETVFVAVMKRLGADLLVCPRGRMVRLGVGDDHFYSRAHLPGINHRSSSLLLESRYGGSIQEHSVRECGYGRESAGGNPC